MEGLLTARVKRGKQRRGQEECREEKKERALTCKEDHLILEAAGQGPRSWGVKEWVAFRVGWVYSKTSTKKK